MVMEILLVHSSWRRRSWLLVIRARQTRGLRTRWERCLKWLGFRRIGDRGRNGDDNFHQVVMKVIDLPEEELFRSIVSYI